MNEPLTLTIKSDDEITLPAGIAASSLTLAEIGAVVVMACLECEQPNQEGLADRMNSKEMKAAGKSLTEKGVLKASFAEGKVTVSIDLEAVGL